MWTSNRYKIKDRLLRKGWKEKEVFIRFLKYLVYNQELSVRLRMKAYLFLTEIGEKQSMTKLKNRCLLTHRGQSNYRLFGLSRISLKKAIHNGLISGFIKAKW